MWDAIDKAGHQALMDNADNSLTEASAADAARWDELTGPIIADVLAEVSAVGVDAAAAQSYIQEQMDAN